MILTGRYPSDIAWDKPGTNYPRPAAPPITTYFEGTLAAAGWSQYAIFLARSLFHRPTGAFSRGFADGPESEGAGTIAESNEDMASPRIVPRVIERLRQAAARPERLRAVGTHLFEPHSSYMTHQGIPERRSSGVPGSAGEVPDYGIAFCDSLGQELIDAGPYF